MPDPALLTPLGKAMLGSLPPRVRGSIDYLAVIHAAAREVELLEAAIETVRAQFNPATADTLLNAWEAMLKLPVGGPAGASIAARRALVQTRLRKLVTTGEGREWEAAIDAIVGAGSWSYLEHDPNPPKNLVPNPSFERDAIGTLPAGWSASVPAWFLNVGGSPSAQAGIPSGTRDMFVTTTNAAFAEGAAISLGVLPAGTYIASALIRGSAGGELVTLFAGIISPGTGNGSFNPTLTTDFVRYSCTFTADGSTTCYVGVRTQTATALSFSVDAVMVTPGSVLRDYGDGDSPGWQWLGAVGNSPSQLVTPPDGEVTITLPYPPGASQFIDASNQIRDITDAHLVLNFASAVVFRLDTDPQDSTQFGA